MAVGQEFETEILLGFDDDGKEIRKTKFVIEELDAKKTIRLNHSVKKSASVDTKFSPYFLYFDRNQQEFSLVNLRNF